MMNIENKQQSWVGNAGINYEFKKMNKNEMYKIKHKENFEKRRRWQLWW